MLFFGRFWKVKLDIHFWKLGKGGQPVKNLLQDTSRISLATIAGEFLETNIAVPLL
ncbi:hypothetical protein NSMS1_60850 (plasmid) [Nostoc sp. MS1]|nr:hypothetical protein NSMS1_60850 [Nostoc sp. MS1]